jgi:hypothetical protein
MIYRYSTSYTTETTPLEMRYPEIIMVLSNSEKPLSYREIVDRYIVCGNASDVLSTRSLLNVLVLAGIAKNHTAFKGTSVHCKYELQRGNSG